MARLKGDGKTVPLNPEQRIEILELLAKGGKTMIEISEKYHTSEKEISRVRDQALTFSSRWRNERSARVQKYLIFCEEKHANRTMRKRVAPENNANQVVVTDKNHIEEKLSKAKSNAQNLEDHYRDLSKTALQIADLIYYIGPDPGEKTINQIVSSMGTWEGEQAPPDEQMEQYEELSKLLASTEAQWLFSHIKSEVPELFVHLMYAHPEFLEFVSYKKPELEQIYGWEDITQDDAYGNGEQLIHLLKLRAAQKEFPGTCEVCERWK